MTTLNPVYYQYRGFDNLYVFKVKSDESLVVKIFDVSQRCLLKRAFFTQDLEVASMKQIFSKADLPTFLETLVQKGLLSREHFSASQRKVRQEDCLQAMTQAIQQFKPKVFIESREMEGFSCPLTLEVFREPVIDEHGHTFEKSAIEEHLKRKNECPINRQPINSLAPNRLVQQTIEEWQKRDPIPNFSLFQRENSKLASTNLQMAQTYVEEKEYREALEFYAKAFQYTRNWSDYVGLPSLFERMQEAEKATLAYLYLAHYQLEDRKLPEAIQTLENCQQGQSACLQIDLLLVKLYNLADQPQKAMQLAIRSAEVLSKQNPEQAITVYKQLLAQYPDQFDLYFCLSHLLESTQEKAQILLKGACHALETGDYKTAERLCHEAEVFSEDSFVDQLVSLDLLRKQKNFPAINQKLISLAESFEKRGLIEQMLKAYKMLFQLEKRPEYCQKIIAAYERLQKPQKQTEWYIACLSLFIKSQDWSKAEQIAQEALPKASEPQKIPLYENLEIVYTHWKEEQLENLWSQLGRSYQVSGQLAAAEKTYQKAFERFHKFEQALALADTLSEQRKVRDSVQVYYEASAQALLDRNLERLDLCAGKIRGIDPHMQELDINQRMHLLTQTHIFRLSRELQETREELHLLKEKIHLKERRKLEEIECKQKEVEEQVSQLAFGKADWERFFGDVGVEPPLPKDIVEVLKSPCPYWGGKRIEETHLLVLIPQSVNGRPLTLSTLQELTQGPKGGGSATQYRHYDGDVRKEHGDQPVPRSYWALMTKDVLPNSRNKTYGEQQALIKGPYTVPGVLEMATGIMMHHVKRGERLYTDSPNTYTRCLEQVCGNQYRVVVGSFGSSGLDVCYGYDDGSCGVGAHRGGLLGLGGVRKF